MSYFLWLLSMVPSFLIYFWPVSLGLAVLTTIGVVIWLRQKLRPRIPVATILSCLTFTIAILLYGTLHAVGPNWEPKPYADIAPYVVYGILLIQLVASVTLVIFTKRGLRIFMSAIVAWELVVSLSSGFIALMSVSSQWL
jgi:hypothetical protein